MTTIRRRRLRPRRLLRLYRTSAWIRWKKRGRSECVRTLKTLTCWSRAAIFCSRASFGTRRTRAFWFWMWAGAANRSWARWSTAIRLVGRHQGKTNFIFDFFVAKKKKLNRKRWENVFFYRNVYLLQAITEILILARDDFKKIFFELQNKIN